MTTRKQNSHVLVSLVLSFLLLQYFGEGSMKPIVDVSAQGEVNPSPSPIPNDPPPPSSTARQSRALAPFPVPTKEDFSCAPAISLTPWLSWKLCYFPARRSKFTHPLNESGQHASFLYPTELPKNHSLVLESHFHGWGNGRGGESQDGGDPGKIVINNNYDIAPMASTYAEAFGIEMPQDWGIALDTLDPKRPCSQGHCEAGNYRFGAAISKAYELFGDSIDTGAGIALAGNCYGGTAIIMLSMALRDEFYRRQIVVVDAATPGNLFVRNADPTELNEFGHGRKTGYYWQDPAIQKSWGNFDISRVDPLLPKNQKKIKGVYFHMFGGSNDYLGFSLDFFRQVCEQGRIACYAQWYLAEHAVGEPGLNYDLYKRYSGDEMVVRLDSMLPIFTNSTANNWGRRGHYNLGLEWKNSGFVDTATRAEIPIRYRRHTNMGLDIVDQPAAAMFDLTIRRFQRFKFNVGSYVKWSVVDPMTQTQTGRSLVTDAGEVTIPHITLHSTPTAYATVVLTLEEKGPDSKSIHRVK